METLDFYYFLFISFIYMPSVILVLGAIIVLLSNAFANHFSRNTSLSLCMLCIATAFLFCLSFEHSENVSRITLYAEYIILAASFCFVFLTFSKHRFAEFQTPEFYPLYLFSVSGFMLMVHGNNLVLVLLGLEIGSLPLAAMLAFNRRIYGIEAGMKYFISSALASIFFIFGIMLFYLVFGNFSLTQNAIEYRHILLHGYVFDSLLLLCSMVFILAGLGFKVSLVPWHSWMPDVYEASNPVFAGYVSVVPKIAGFALFAMIFIPLLQGESPIHSSIDTLVRILLILTITLPNIAALLQKDVKRMLAFSSISHSGFALVCIYLGIFETLVFYWIVFLITNLGAFTMLWINKPIQSQSRYDYAFSNFHGFGKQRPIVSLALAFFMIALAGIPPLSIFWGKIAIVTNSLQQGEILLAFAMMLNSAIAVCYYLKLIVAMYFKQSATPNQPFFEDNSTAPIRFIALSCALLCCGSIFLFSYLSGFMSVVV